MRIGNNNGPKTESCGTPVALIGRSPDKTHLFAPEYTILALSQTINLGGLF